jgi:hypothetical protein
MMLFDQHFISPSPTTPKPNSPMVNCLCVSIRGYGFVLIFVTAIEVNA